MTGRVKAVLYAATDGPSTDWVARLCDVDEHGLSRNVTDGIVRVRAATPGEAAEHVVDLWSTSILFRTGHRIRLQAASGNFPRSAVKPSSDQRTDQVRLDQVAPRPSGNRKPGGRGGGHRLHRPSSSGPLTLTGPQ